MSKLYLRGIQKPFTLEKETALKINRMLDDPAIPKDKQFEKDGMRFTKADIRYLIVNDQDDDGATSSDERKRENESYYNDQQSEYKNNVRNLCKRSVEVKSNDVKMFETFYFGVTGDKPTNEIVSKVVELQSEYFSKYPTHPYARVNYFKLVSEYPQPMGERFDMKYHVASFSMRLIENVMTEAFREAHFQKLL